jgi:hypothetical protein
MVNRNEASGNGKFGIITDVPSIIQDCRHFIMGFAQPLFRPDTIRKLISVPKWNSGAILRVPSRSSVPHNGSELRGNIAHNSLLA